MDSVEPQKNEATHVLFDEHLIDAADVANKIYQLWWNWADFHLYVITPTFAPINPPHVIHPEPIEDSTELEFVYPIHDFGYKLSTSKGEEMLVAGRSMCKLYYTIEKMIRIFVDRLADSGTATDFEVQVSFDGHLLAQRKAFESIINLSYNVVVTNFDPGTWGEKYLEIVKRLADKGYGYPPEAPRDNYRHAFTPVSTSMSGKKG